MPGLIFNTQTGRFASPMVDVANPVNWQHPLNIGRIAWYKCIANPGWRGGSILHDLVRGPGHTPNDGVLTGTPKPTWHGSQGLVGSDGSLSFNGSNTVVTGNNKVADNLPSMTVSCWIKYTSLISGIDANFIVTKIAINNGNGWGFYIANTTGSGLIYGCLGFFTQSNNGSDYNECDGTVPLPINKWIYVSAAYSGGAAGLIKLYVNGKFYTSGNDGTGLVTSTSSTTPVIIGSDASPIAAESFIGSIDDVSIWNRALSAQEIADIYNLSRQGYPGVINYFSPVEYSFPTLSSESVGTATGTSSAVSFTISTGTASGTSTANCISASPSILSSISTSPPILLRTVNSNLINPANPVNWQHPLNIGRIAWYKCIANPGWRGGSVLHDLVRGPGHTPNDGVLTGTPKPTWHGSQGLVGTDGSLTFNGSTNYVITSNNKVADNLPSMTVSAWVKFPTGLLAGNNQDCIVTKINNGSTGTGWGLYIWGTNSDGLVPGGLGFFTQDNSGNDYNEQDATIALSVNKWNYVTATYSGGVSSLIRLYVNGSKINTTNNSAGSPVVNTSNVNPIVIGWDAGLEAQSQFLGSIDDVSIWNRALSAQEIADIYNLSRQGYPGVINYFSPVEYSFPTLSSGSVGTATGTSSAVSGTSSTTNIALDAVSNSGYQNATSSLSWSHTWNGNYRMLSIDVSLLSVNDTVLSMTYGGATCTLIGTQNVVGGTGRVECWEICQNNNGAPAAGANTISVTLSGSVAATGTAVSYVNVNQTNPTEAFAGNSGINIASSTNATVTVTTISNNDWVHAALSTNQNSGIASSQTSRNIVTGALGTGADADVGPNVPSAQIMTWTGESSTSMWAVAGYGIVPGVYITAIAFGSSNAGFTSGSTGTAAGTSTTNGTSTEVALSTGTATGTSSAAGTSTEVTLSTGTATGTSSAASISTEVASSTGTAIGTSSVTSTSIEVASSTGTAIGNSTASDVTPSIAAFNITGTSTASAIGPISWAMSGYALKPLVNTVIISSAGIAYGTSTASGVILISGSAGTANSSSNASGQVGVTGIVLGTSTVSGIVGSIAIASGSSIATASSISTGTAIGTSSAAGTSTEVTLSVVTATGTSSVAGASTEIALSAGIATGTSTANGQLSYTAITLGTSTANAVGTTSTATLMTWTGEGTTSQWAVAGYGIVPAIGVTSIGTAFGTSTANGQAGTGASVCVATGTSSAAGISTELTLSTGTALGTSTANGISTEIALSTGTALGTSSAASQLASIGIATGTSTSSGTSAEITLSTGTATGTSTISAVGASIVSSAGGVPSLFWVQDAMVAKSISSPTSANPFITNPTIGNCIIVWTWVNVSTASSLISANITCSDNIGNTWTQAGFGAAGNASNGNLNTAVAIFYSIITSTGANFTPTVTCSVAPTYMTVAASEFRGVSSLFESVINNGTIGSSGTVSAGNLYANQNNLVVAALQFASQSNETIGTPVGWTQPDSAKNDSTT